MIKRLFLGVPSSFPPENGVFILFSTNSTQLELPVFEFFWEFCLSFFRIFLEFWVFWAWVLFPNVQNKSLNWTWNWLCITFVFLSSPASACLAIRWDCLSSLWSCWESCWWQLASAWHVSQIRSTIRLSSVVKGHRSFVGHQFSDTWKMSREKC